MVTVQHLVEKLIEQKPFLQEALSRGVINNAALAEELLPDIEKELKKKIKFSAVNMAIRRLSEKLSKSFIEKAKFDNTTDISIQSDLVEITIYKSDISKEKIKKIYDIVDIKEGDFLTITQGLHEIMFITNKKHEQEVLNLFEKKSVKKILKNLSSITLNIPINAIETVGLFYIASRALNWENINIVEIVSTLTEMTFIVNEVDTPKAFTSLKKLVQKNK